MTTAVAASAVQQLFDVPVHALTLEEVVARADAAIAGRRRLRIGVVNAAKIVNMRRDPALREDVLASDLILADGMAVVWASRLLGRPLPERVAGIDLMVALLRRGHERGYSVYCLGATAEVLGRATERIAMEYPGIRVVGRHHGYFEASEEPVLVQAIGAARPDILFVAMSSPRKETFLARWGGVLDVSVCHGVGGSFDVLAGALRRAPRSWQRMGLEWLYRLLQEPGRLWKRYLVTNALFCNMLLRELAREPPWRRRT